MPNSSPTRGSGRLLVTGPLPGAVNLALDEVLLAAAAISPPVVRLYAWDPPTLSLGYGQRADDVDRAACAAHGVEVTRRLTGGRAVLHADEWTYSVIVAAELLGTGRSISRAYGLLSGYLSASLARLGVAATCTPRSLAGSSASDPACFATTLGGDLSVGGRKLVGSAQCHKLGGILQHGSIPRTIDHALLDACLRRPAEAGVGWRCLADLGVDPSRDELAEALASGFAGLLGDAPSTGPPTADELAAAERLAADKYATEAWLTRI